MSSRFLSDTDVWLLYCAARLAELDGVPLGRQHRQQAELLYDAESWRAMQPTEAAECHFAASVHRAAA
jgi:hypothetical protein